jgi:hypothetical protein
MIQCEQKLSCIAHTDDLDVKSRIIRAMKESILMKIKNMDD